MKKLIICIILIIVFNTITKAQYMTTFVSQQSGQEYLIKNSVTEETMLFYSEIIRNFEATQEKIDVDKGIFWGGFIVELCSIGLFSIGARSNYDALLTAGYVTFCAGDLLMLVGGIRWIVHYSERARQEIRLAANGIVVSF